MPINLKQAVQAAQAFGPAPKSPKGTYKAYWIGQSEPFERIDERTKCGVCMGQRIDAAQDGPCTYCNGTGKKIESRVLLRYSLENGETEEEDVNFKLSEGGVARNGNPISPSTMYNRYAELSGLTKASDIMQWAADLPDQIKIPCTVIIGLNQTRTALKITDVQSREATRGNARSAAPAARAAQPPPEKVSESAVTEDDNWPEDDEGDVSF